ncbi:glutamyl-tRNA reductase [Gottfriedia acidiceleris]|uniref:glutamyl-tRNA reductase n=1 Tax=Gottfriedia acidiceleris TaxID=371036 RepID=UPI003D2042DC
MHILVVSLNYRTAPIEIREKLTFNPSDSAIAMKSLQEKSSIIENVILSTCNRTEIYAVVSELNSGKNEVTEFIAEWFNIEKNELLSCLFFYEQDVAIEHLFKVTCGLDSLILGETQILGQVRTSFLLAQRENTTGMIFNHSFKKAVTLGKRAHTETEIGSKAVSVSYAAVELAKKIFKGLNNTSILILGAGHMAELACKNLQGNGANRVTVINRSFENAKLLANRYSVEVKPWDELLNTMLESDLIISTTSAEEYVITREMIIEVNKFRKVKPLYFIDISVPRNINPTICEFANIFLYNIDDLQNIVNSNIMERKKATKKIMNMIEGEINEHKNWVNLLEIVPIISALNKKASFIQLEIQESIKNKLPNLSEHDLKVINKHLGSIINQFLKAPIRGMKDLASSKESNVDINLLRKLFNIEQEVIVDK